MEKILKNEQKNEETNERASERIEQKFINEILGKTWEIEENPFSGTTIGCSGKFQKILGIAINFILREKTKKYKEKVQWKNGDFRHIPGIFGRKKVFLKNRSRSCLGHWYYAFMNKQSVKTNDEISRKRQKLVFPAYFSHFLQEKYVFSKIGLCHILGIAILWFCISVQNFMKKYKVRLGKFNKYLFSAKIGCSGDF